MAHPLPVYVRQTLEAARDHLRLGHLYVTFSPDDPGPKWEFHPFRRWLILRSPEPGAIQAGIATAVLARTANLGKGAVTEVPEKLVPRYHAVLAALLCAIEDIGQQPQSKI